MVPPQIVLDTSVLVSGLRSRDGASFQILERIGTGVFDLNLSVPLVLEYEEVLKREARALGLSLQDVDDLLDYLCAVGRPRKIFFLWRPVLKDPFDDHLLEVAVEAGCEFIVTHNLHDFTRSREFGVHAIKPGAFLRRLAERGRAR